MAADYSLAPEQVAPLPERLRSVPPIAETLGGYTLRLVEDNSVVDLDNLRPGESIFAKTTIEDREHLVHITEPTRPNPDHHLVASFPGMLEMIDFGSGLARHNALAAAYTSSRIVSVATDGVGVLCPKLEWGQSMHLTFRTMASDRLTITSMIAQNGPTTMVDVSMASRIGLEMAKQNLYNPVLTIERIINRSHAQVPLRHVPNDMVWKFTRHVLREHIHEVVRHPGIPREQMLGMIATIAAQMPAYVGNVKNLLRGASLKDVYEVASVVPTNYLSGTRDPLTQPTQLMKLQKTFPKNVGVQLLEGQGHNGFLNVARTIQEILSIDQARHQFTRVCIL